MLSKREAAGPIEAKFHVLNTTNHHKTPQTTTEHHKPHHKQTQSPNKSLHTSIKQYSDPNLGRICCGLECGVQKGYDIVKFVTANIHW